MSNDLKPYASMKSSGVEWLGKVPEHWEVSHLGQIGAFSKGRGGSKEDETQSGVPCIRYGDLYTTHQHFIRASRSYVSQKRSPHYTSIKYGDVLFAASGETAEEIGKSAVNLIQSEVCCGGDVILFRPTREISPKFLGYATDSRPAIAQKAIMGRGFTVVHIYGDQLKRLCLALPPTVLEQNAIARFLDHATDQIERYIRAKEKLIALLEEQKQVMIHDAITGRIDVRSGEPYPAYKPSSVEWLGNVPTHWDVVALRFRYSQCLGKMLDTKRITGEHLVPYLRNVDVQWDRINTQELPTMDISPAEIARFTVEPGDLLVCEGGEVGRCALWSGDLPLCGFQKALHRLRPISADRDVPRFLCYALKAATHRNAFDDGHESTISHLTGEKFRAHRFPFPPLSEQEAIHSFLDSGFSVVDGKIDHENDQIALINEYRTRLIADVVTGKLDVRKAAANLPVLDAIADGGDEEIPTESDSQQSNSTLHNEAPPIVSGVGS